MTKQKWQAEKAKGFTEEEPPFEDEFEEGSEGTEEAEQGLSHDELLKQLADAEAKVEEQVDALLRIQADMENVRKRAQRDVANAHKYALEKFITQLLPVIDTLERSLAVEVDGDAIAAKIHEGVDLTLKMFVDTLAKFDVEVVNPLGEAFNAEFHEAVSMVNDPEADSGTVLQVLQKGYLLNGRLIRPAMVLVSS